MEAFSVCKRLFPLIFTLGCGGDAAPCEDVGGKRVDGVCQCPEGSSVQNGACVASATDASATDASATDASMPRDASDEGADGGLDASSVPDAAHSEDGGEPVRDDASTPVHEDAALPAAPDAATQPDASFTCAPHGSWLTTYHERTGGTCGAMLAPFTVELQGHMDDAIKSETSCTLAVDTLSADGCMLTYDQACPLDDPTKKWHETGTLWLVSPTHAVGTAHVTVDDPSVTKDQQCQSDVDIVVDAVN